MSPSTLFAGPIGFLLYLALRTAVARTCFAWA